MGPPFKAEDVHTAHFMDEILQSLGVAGLGKVDDEGFSCFLLCLCAIHAPDTAVPSFRTGRMLYSV